MWYLARHVFRSKCSLEHAIGGDGKQPFRGPPWSWGRGLRQRDAFRWSRPCRSPVLGFLCPWTIPVGFAERKARPLSAPTTSGPQGAQPHVSVSRVPGSGPIGCCTGALGHRLCCSGAAISPFSTRACSGAVCREGRISSKGPGATLGKRAPQILGRAGCEAPRGWRELPQPRFRPGS